MMRFYVQATSRFARISRTYVLIERVCGDDEGGRGRGYPSLILSVLAIAGVTVVFFQWDQLAPLVGQFFN